ncbi:MAG: MFS transporter, partial [Bryobacteraceae bacterium]
ASCQACAVLFVIGSYAPWPAVALGACVAAGLAGSCLWPSMLAASADRFPQGGATMFALLSALGNAGGIFVPWAIGLAADRWTLRAGLALSAVCPLLMTLALRRMGHVQEK